MDVSRVSRERIASLDDAGLNTLMSDLLRAHAYRSNGSEAQVRTNTDLKAGDDGCDGWTPAPRVRDDWFAGEPMCWQFKAGTAEKRNNSDHREAALHLRPKFRVDELNGLVGFAPGYVVDPDSTDVSAKDGFVNQGHDCSCDRGLP